MAEEMPLWPAFYYQVKHKAERAALSSTPVSRSNNTAVLWAGNKADDRAALSKKSS